MRTKSPPACRRRSRSPPRTTTLAEALRDRIAQPTFRIYLSDDVAGAEIGGAVKNVLAIACGVVDGKGLGQNARAALIARGFAEMTRFGLANGAKRETLAGLSGLGDLVLTCSSTSSRNFSLGKGIGEGRSPAELMSDRKTVAEGAFTAPVLARLAQQMGIDMPVVAAVDKLLSGKAGVDQVLHRAARAAASRGGPLEIDRDALLLPVAVARGIEPLLFSGRRRGLVSGLGLRDRRRLGQVIGHLGTFGFGHGMKMCVGRRYAKR